MAGIINFNNYASKYYIKGEKLTRIPFSKFQWTVAFQRNDGSEEPTDLTYIIKSVDLPGWEIQQQTLNQYNKKRVVNTTIALKPVSLVFLDTVDGKFRTFIQEYMNSFSYNFSFRGANAIQSRDQLSNDIDNTFGIFPQNAPDDNFLKTITINQEYGGEIWAVSLYNPKITSVTHDQLDYSQANGFVTWTITVQPEAVVHNLLSSLQPDYVAELSNSTITEGAASLGGNGTSATTPLVDSTGRVAAGAIVTSASATGSRYSSASRIISTIVPETHGDPANPDGSRNSDSPVNADNRRNQSEGGVAGLRAGAFGAGSFSGFSGTFGAAASFGSGSSLFSEAGSLGGAGDLDGFNEPGYMGSAYTGPAPANFSDFAVNGLDLDEAKGAVSNSMNNIVYNSSFPTAALGGIQDKPGGSIPSGFAINAGQLSGPVTSSFATSASGLASDIAGGIGKVAAGVSDVTKQISNVTSGAIGAVSQVTGIAYALTQIPGLRKYTKGPIAKLAKAGMKLRMVNNVAKSVPQSLTGLQKYIKGFDPKSIGGKWL